LNSQDRLLLYLIEPKYKGIKFINLREVDNYLSTPECNWASGLLYTGDVEVEVSHPQNAQKREVGHDE
jgi:hypothetical protein